MKKNALSDTGKTNPIYAHACTQSGIQALLLWALAIKVTAPRR